MQAIERQQGRQRNIRWGARTLDLDLLLYDSLILDSDRLQLPHPEMLKRNFVLMPLLDLAPNLLLPDGSELKHRAQAIDQVGLHLLPGQ